MTPVDVEDPNQPEQQNVAVAETLFPETSIADPIVDLETPAPRAAEPVRADERISAIDTLRGFALLGILLMNILAFALPFQATSNPTVMGGATGANLVTWFTAFVLWDGKMRAIFSMMFGASVYLLVDRISRRSSGLDAADVHYRRMMWMLLFGMIHAYVIWFGDILFPYATMGLLLFPLRKLSPKALLITASVMILLMSGAGIANGFRVKNAFADYQKVVAEEKAGKTLTEEQKKQKESWTEILKEFAPPADEVKKDVDAHRGSYAKLFVYRAKLVFNWHSMPIYFPLFWDMLAMMLIGMAFIKMRVLTAERSYRFYTWMAVIGFGIGLPSHAVMAWYGMNEKFSPLAMGWSLSTYELGRLTALGYCAVLLMLVKAGALRWLTGTLAKVGQMAFSNYILTSVICTTIFYGYGFGAYGKLERWQLYVVVLAVWVVLIGFSLFWMARYRFGPLEWVWRSLTYWKRQPMRLSDDVAKLEAA
jgi:uncharacterized protein